MKKLISAATIAIAMGVALHAQTKPAKPLEIYVIDVEGGKADLWVTPSGQSLLIDTGSPGGRDTDRIMEVMAAAGVTKLDYLLVTHYHVDHVGVLELVKRLPPIPHFLDHGPTVEDGAEGHQREQVPGFQAAYAELYGKAQHTVLKPGDRIPVPGLDWQVVMSAGKVLKTPLPAGGKPNAACAGVQRQDVTRDPENGQSVGSIISYGPFRAADFGDATQDIEYDLMCPNNPIGVVDVFFASNHGTNNANSPTLIRGIQPRVAVVQNNPRKGASVEMFQALRSSPRLEDVWELHWGNAAGVEWNSPGVFIANGVEPQAIAAVLTAPPAAGGGPGGPPAAPGAAAAAPGAPPAAPGAPAAPAAGRGGAPAPPHSPAYWIKIAVQADGTYTVTNSRNNFSKTYKSYSQK
jgi:competence protein ComEC